MGIIPPIGIPPIGIIPPMGIMPPIPPIPPMGIIPPMPPIPPIPPIGIMPMPAPKPRNTMAVLIMAYEVWAPMRMKGTVVARLRRPPSSAVLAADGDKRLPVGD